MPHRDFAYSVAFCVCEYGDEAMKLAKEFDVLCDFATISLEAAVKVVELHATGSAREAIEYFGGKCFSDGVVTDLFPSGDEVVAFVYFFQKRWNFGWVIL